MDTSKTIANSTTIFLAIHIHIKTITFDKFYCYGAAPVFCLLQFFSYYFYNCCSYFYALKFFLRFWYLLLLLYICLLTFVDCIFIFFQRTLNEWLNLRRKIGPRKHSCNFLKIQLLIGKSTQEVKCHSDRGHVIN